MLLPENDSGLLDAVRHAKHNEPESHISTLARMVWQAVASDNGAEKYKSACGVTNKDLPLVRSLNELFASSSASNKICLPEYHCLEAQEIISRHCHQIKHEPSSILVIRHLLEHARDLDSFLSGVWHMIGQDGLCLIEVPDSTSLIMKGDLSQLWEEHTAYLTPSTFQRLLQNHGFELIFYQAMASDGEDLCIGLIRRNGSKEKCLSNEPASIHADDFIARFPLLLNSIVLALQAAQHDRLIYVFGANHIAGTFLDLLAGDVDLIEAILDDDAEKDGCTLGLSSKSIKLANKIGAEQPLEILVAVNEGRYPNLYHRLRQRFPSSKGHRVESLVKFFVNAWEVT